MAGHDVVSEFRKTRSIIGLVPQELTTDLFETVFNTVSFSRGSTAESRSRLYREHPPRAVATGTSATTSLLELSGGMKARVLIAKALAAPAPPLFLDEPTACVDVNLRKGYVAARLAAA